MSGLLKLGWEGIFLSAWRPYMWLALAGFLLYSKVLHFGFTNLDDNYLILGNYHHLKELSILSRAFQEDVFFMQGRGAYYRPLFTLSLALDARLGGLSPFIYHLDNILIHFLAASLVFAFLIRLGYARGAAFFSALLFDVHPVLSPAVAWIPGRNDSLAGVFVLAYVLAFISYLEVPPGPQIWIRYLFHLVFYALALFTKETAVVSVGVCAGYALWIAERRRYRRLAAAAVGWLVVILLWYLLRIAVLQNPLNISLATMAHSTHQSLPVVLQYLGKIFLPFNLSVLPTIPDTTLIYGLVTVPILGLVVAVGGRRWNRIGFGFLWFVLFFLPIIILRSTSAANIVLEHRMYLPIIGMLIVLMELSLKDWSARKPQVVAAGVAVLLGFSALTWSHLENFRDDRAFWTAATRSSPRLVMAHMNLGGIYLSAGLLDLAEAEYRTALALNPRERSAHGKLGVVLMQAKRTREAATEFQKEILIMHFEKRGNSPEAALYFGRLRELDPQTYEAVVKKLQIRAKSRLNR